MNIGRLDNQLDKIIVAGLTRLYRAQGKELPYWTCEEQAAYQVAMWNKDGVRAYCYLSPYKLAEMIVPTPVELEWEKQQERRAKFLG